MDTAIKNIFYPKTISVVGASSKEKSIGYEILKSIKNYGYTGNVFPVNPKADEILGFKCWKSILDIEEKIDLAIIVVPKKFVDESIDLLIRKDVQAIILITAGFKETGEEGAGNEKKLLHKIKESNARMIGPNCMGVINTLDSIRLNATFVAEYPQKGGIAFLSQSGALGAAVLNSLRETDIRFAHFISIGNKADVNEIELLKFWLNDDNIKIITFYLESFENGIELLRSYSKSGNKKPLIILKAGKTEAGMKAASSHTGALSSDEKLTDSLLKQFGVIRVDTISEMFNTAKGFENFPMPRDNKVAVVTNAGGPAILAVDKIEERNLVLADLSSNTKNKLKEIVHPEGSLNNPIDLLPGGSPEIYKKTNEILLLDDNVDAVISIFVEPVMVDAMSVVESVNTIKSSKPIFQVCMPLPEFWEEYSNSSERRIPIFKNPEDPAIIISNILQYEKNKREKRIFSKPFISQLSNSGIAEFLDQNEVFDLCKQYGIPLVKSLTVNPKNIANINIDFPLVIKGQSKNVVHKSDLNAVKLNIKNDTEIKKAVDEINNSFVKAGFELDEILIQQFVKTKHELLVGGYRDTSFGPIVMFGSGGKYVEYLDDTQIRSAYLTGKDLDEIIDETKIGRIIKGVRGEDRVDINKLKMIIMGISSMMLDHEEIFEIDLNPIIIDDQNNYIAVDIRIKSIKPT